MLEFVISDGQPLTSTVSTTVKIYNNPPIFTKEVPKDMTIRINDIFDFELPEYADSENDTVKVTFDASPDGIIDDFASLEPDGLMIRFSPSQQY